MRSGVARTATRNAARRLGTYLRGLRTGQGWTQSELAEMVEVEPVTIRRWELGMFSPSLSNSERLADIYGVGVGNLMSAANVERTPNDAYEVLGDAVIISDGEDKLTFMNSAAETLLGYSSDEILDRGLSEMVPDGAEIVTIDTVRETANQEWKGTVPRAKRTGEIFDAQLTVTPLKDTNGRAVGLVSIVRDVREYRTEFQDGLSQLWSRVADSLPIIADEFLCGRGAAHIACKHRID